MANFLQRLLKDLREYQQRGANLRTGDDRTNQRQRVSNVRANQRRLAVFRIGKICAANDNDLSGRPRYLLETRGLIDELI